MSDRIEATLLRTPAQALVQGADRWSTVFRITALIAWVLALLAAFGALVEVPDATIVAILGAVVALGAIAVLALIRIRRLNHALTTVAWLRENGLLTDRGDLDEAMTSGPPSEGAAAIRAYRESALALADGGSWLEPLAAASGGIGPIPTTRAASRNAAHRELRRRVIVAVGIVLAFGVVGLIFEGIRTSGRGAAADVAFELDYAGHPPPEGWQDPAGRIAAQVDASLLSASLTGPVAAASSQGTYCLTWQPGTTLRLSGPGSRDGRVGSVTLDLGNSSGLSVVAKVTYADQPNVAFKTELGGDLSKEVRTEFPLAQDGQATVAC
jgi:hypothetical protein